MLILEDRLTRLTLAPEAGGSLAGKPTMLIQKALKADPDNPMALWINDFDPHLPPAAQINQKRLDAALAIVRAAFAVSSVLRGRPLRRS